MPDAWIMATAKQYEFTLVSHDGDMLVAKEVGIELIQLESSDLKDHVVGHILATYLADNVKAWKLLPDGSYTRIHTGPRSLLAFELRQSILCHGLSFFEEHLESAQRHVRVVAK